MHQKIETLKEDLSRQQENGQGENDLVEKVKELEEQAKIDQTQIEVLRGEVEDLKEQLQLEREGKEKDEDRDTIERLEDEIRNLKSEVEDTNELHEEIQSLQRQLKDLAEEHEAELDEIRKRRSGIDDDDDDHRERLDELEYQAGIDRDTIENLKEENEDLKGKLYNKREPETVSKTGIKGERDENNNSNDDDVVKDLVIEKLENEIIMLKRASRKNQSNGNMEYERDHGTGEQDVIGTKESMQQKLLRERQLSRTYREVIWYYEQKLGKIMSYLREKDDVGLASEIKDIFGEPAEVQELRRKITFYKVAYTEALKFISNLEFAKIVLARQNRSLRHT